MKTRITIALAAMLAGIAWLASATDFTGWSGTGNPDLASPETWGLESGLPTDAINIKASGYTFEASDDATITAIYFSKASITNTFKLAANRKITLNNGTGYALCGGANGGYKYMQTTFSGGTWDVGGGFFGPIYHYSYAPLGNTFILDDGCIITNVGTFRVSYGNNADNSRNRVTIKGGSQLHVKTANVVQGWGRNNTFEVLDGLFTWSQSALVATGSGRTGAEGAYGNVLRVSGPNARVVNLSDSVFYIGNDNDHDSQVLIENGGVWTNSSKGIYIGNGAAWNQRLIVRSGGKLMKPGTIYVNFASGACSNSFEVLDGGIVETSDSICIGSSASRSNNIDGLILVSNATLRCNRIMQGSGISPGQVVRIMGTNTVFETSYDTSSYPVFGSGSYCLFSLEDGAEWRYDLRDLAFGYTTTFAPSNQIQVINGARLLLGKGITMGYGDKKTEGHVLYVGNDAEFRCGASFSIYAHDNSIIVSNALFSVGGQLNFGVAAAETGGFTNNTLAVQGDVPRVRIGGQVTAKDGTRIIFNVPQGGYATTNVPITCASWSDAAKTKFEFTGLEELRASLEKRIVMPLLQLTNSTFSTKFKTSVAAAKERLPAKCSLSYSDDNDLLRLTVRPDVGGLLLVR